MASENIVKAGIGISGGYAIGTALVVGRRESKEEERTAGTPEVEISRLKNAAEQAGLQLRHIAEKANQKINDKSAEIIRSQILFLDDPAFMGEALEKIRKEACSAEKAMNDVTESLYGVFLTFEDEYTRERAADIKDVGERIVRNLSGSAEKANFSAMAPDTVLFSYDLKPSDTVQIDEQKVLAFVTEIGGKTSHTAILAKALGIAAVSGCTGVLAQVRTGMRVLVDGTSGTVILDPEKDAVQKYKTRIEALKKSKAERAAVMGKDVRTKDGKKILVAANIGSLEDLKKALENGADGVGLFRTEFLYMNRQKMPSEEEQFKVYREAAQMLNGKPLTIRTLDIGGDKSLPYFEMPKEANPFLGLRAIRLCLKETGLFRLQLRALLRASAFGNIRIMFPMIGSQKELSRAKEILNECRRELDAEGEKYNPSVPVGMMVEVPSAAITADSFAKECDFFSIGTNDLTQYVLAADRMNETVSDLYDSMHPAVLRLIETTIRAAHNALIPCAMCGELASDEKAIPILLQYGLDEFSVSPGALAETKYALLKQSEKE